MRSKLLSILMIGGSMLALGAANAGASAPEPGSAIDATATTSLVSLCQQIATEEKVGNNSHRGQCVSGTTNWLGELIPKGSDDADRDKAIADLVVQLAGLVQTSGCGQFTSEVAQAVQLAGQASSDSEQAQRISTISETISSCQDQVLTSALVPSSLNTLQ